MNEPRNEPATNAQDDDAFHQAIEKIINDGIVIGEGYFAYVYRGEFNGEGLAVKAFKNTDPDIVAATRRKLDDILTLSHKNVVRLLCAHAFQPSGVAAVMELANKNLTQLLARGGVNRRLKVSIAKDVTSGLVFLHEHKFAHRDLKPSNILLFGTPKICSAEAESDQPTAASSENVDSMEWTAKLADLDLCHQFKNGENTDTERCQGTDHYMAPELLTARMSGTRGRYSVQVDVYSLALTLYVLFTEMSLRDGFNVAYDFSVMYMLLERNDRPRFPDDFQPPLLKTLIMECWSRDPAERPRSAMVYMHCKHLQEEYSVMFNDTPLELRNAAVVEPGARREVEQIPAEIVIEARWLTHVGTLGAGYFASVELMELLALGDPNRKQKVAVKACKEAYGRAAQESYGRELHGQEFYGRESYGRTEYTDPGSTKERAREEIGYDASKGKKELISEAWQDVSPFYREALIMSRLKHPNVLGLIGVVVDDTKGPMIVLPHMPNGDLLTYLRKNQQPEASANPYAPSAPLKIQQCSLSTSDEYCSTLPISYSADELASAPQACFESARQHWSQCPSAAGDVHKERLTFAREIADGMEYLHSLHYIHRDLAARNCLLDDGNHIKIADFGLCRLTDVDGRYDNPTNSPLPVAWLAPECIEGHEFSQKTDVWSYGVVLWEIMSSGAHPYEDLMHGSNRFLGGLFELLKNGYRLPLLDFPMPLYEVMLSCWDNEPKKRPTFGDLAVYFEEMSKTSTPSELVHPSTFWLPFDE